MLVTLPTEGEEALNSLICMTEVALLPVWSVLLLLRDTRIWSFLLSLFEKVSNVNAFTELLTNTSDSIISSTESSKFAYWCFLTLCLFLPLHQ